MYIGPGADLPGWHRVANATLKESLATPAATPVGSNKLKVMASYNQIQRILHLQSAAPSRARARQKQMTGCVCVHLSLIGLSLLVNVRIFEMTNQIKVGGLYVHRR